jgi:serine/threonine-protein kinase
MTLAAAGLGFATLLGIDAATDPDDSTAPSVVEAPESLSATPTEGGESASVAPTEPPTEDGEATDDGVVPFDDGPVATSPPATPEGTPKPPPSPRAEPKPLFPHEAVYIGRSWNGETAVAVAVYERQAAVYTCDGVNIESWFTGRVEGDRAELTGWGDTIRFRLTDNGAVAGEATINGDSFSFTARRAHEPAGLYRAETADGETKIGWIVLPDGSQVGVMSNGMATEPAPPLVPGVPVTVDGESVMGSEVRGDDSF